MNDKQWKPFCALIQLADEVTAGKPRSETALGFMFKILERYDFGAVERAVEDHLRSQKFTVTPSDIIKRIEGTAEERAMLAWNCVVHAIQRFGRCASVRFPSPAYHYAIRQMGGWQGLCANLRNDELAFRGKDFERFFEIGERVASWEHETGKVCVQPYLMGWNEANNRRGGYALPDVVDTTTEKPIQGVRERAVLLGPDPTSAVVMNIVKSMKVS